MTDDDLEIPMPNEWVPREYQLPALQALDEGCRRALLMWHRKAGKDSTAMNWVATRMCREPTSVLYLFPEFGQAKRTVFRELTNEGKTYLDQAFPMEIRKGIANSQEGYLRLFNDSILQVGGFDNIDRYIGSNPRVVIMSEYALSAHGYRAWQLLTPILRGNGGTAVFVYTPRGNNHGKKLYDTALDDPSWYVSKLSCDQTGIEVDLDGVMTPLAAAVARDVTRGEVDENYARQEYYCSFEAPNTGSYYGRLLEQAEEQGRITELPWDPSLPVYTWWDIGTRDATVIWFVQRKREGSIRVIDYYEADEEQLAHYLDQLNERRAMGWMFDPRGQLVPHDFASRAPLQQSPEQVARQLGWRMTVVPREENLLHGIDAVRRTLPMCWFDKGRCAVGLERLKAYTKRWSVQLERFMGPEHDNASHAADAFRVGVNGMQLAGMGLAPNVTQAMRDGERQMFRTQGSIVAPMDFSVWGKR